MLLEESSFTNLAVLLKKHIIDDAKSTFKMSLPPLFYLLSLEFKGIANDILPSEAKASDCFYVVGVATASLIILKKKYFLTQILAILFIAVGLTYFPTDYRLSTSSFTLSNLFDDQELYAYISIVAAIGCYGLTFAILEHNLKASEVSLWIKGIQMNLFVVPLSFMICLGNYYMYESPRGFFDNFNIIAWFFIIFIVACNMMQLFVIKVADSMFRMIALSIATVIFGVMKCPFTFDTQSEVKVGTGLVLAGCFLYTLIDIAYPNFNPLSDEGIQDFQSYAIPMKLYYQSVPTLSSKIKNNIIES